MKNILSNCLMGIILFGNLSAQQPIVTPPFTSISITNPVANGNMKTQQVVVSFGIVNSSAKTADLLISTNKYNLKAIDETGKKYYISLIQLGQKKEDILFAISTQLKAGDSSECKLYFARFDAKAKFIKMVQANTTLTLDHVYAGDSTLVMTNIKIAWK
jgi:hypothetical protein